MQCKKLLGSRYDMHCVLERAQLRPQLKPKACMMGLKMYTLDLRGNNSSTVIFKVVIIVHLTIIPTK